MINISLGVTSIVQCHRHFRGCSRVDPENRKDWSWDWISITIWEWGPAFWRKYNVQSEIGCCWVCQPMRKLTRLVGQPTRLHVNMAALIVYVYLYLLKKKKGFSTKGFTWSIFLTTQNKSEISNPSLGLLAMHLFI